MKQTCGDMALKGVEGMDGRQEEFEDLLGLLLDNVSGPDAETDMVARWMAVSCLGENHLWQDMGLPHRGALSSLMETYFKPLFDMNVKDMKWKKFFYKQICERGGFHLCKSPSCGVCIDYDRCFGPEV
ncbi:MAG: nitrogen fixation protein NifQ [Nitrospirota bacterium]